MPAKYGDPCLSGYGEPVSSWRSLSYLGAQWIKKTLTKMQYEYTTSALLAGGTDDLIFFKKGTLRRTILARLVLYLAS